jgi:SHS2 domain-containing protein
MQNFELLEHPADIGFRAFGASLAELFQNCAFAMLSIAYELDLVRESAEFSFEAAGADCESLLVNFLNELLYLTDGRRLALRSVAVRELAPGRVAASAYGEPRDPARHRARVVVKAVTYHQLRVSETRVGCVAEIYLDI